MKYEACGPTEQRQIVQAFFERVGFIVVKYIDPEEMARDDQNGFAENIAGALNGLKLPIVGLATLDDWRVQCEHFFEPVQYLGEPDPVGFRKVVAE